MSKANISPVNQTNFQNRHIGVTSNDLSSMLEVIGVSSLSELISQTIPKDILSYKKINLPPAHTESQALQKLSQIIQKKSGLQIIYRHGLLSYSELHLLFNETS